MPKGEEDWTEDEIIICVTHYVSALKAGGAKKSIAKDVYLARAQKQLPKRNDGSVARRMGNISHVLAQAGGEPVIGWTALANVGPTNTPRIEKALRDLGAL